MSGPQPSGEGLSRTKADLPYSRGNSAADAYRLDLQHQLLLRSTLRVCPENVGLASLCDHLSPLPKISLLLFICTYTLLVLFL